MNILFLVERYPTKADPVFTFVRELIVSICKEGNTCSVICPQSISREIVHRVPFRKRIWFDEIDDNNKITVYQPYYITVSNKTIRLNDFLFQKAAQKCFEKIKEDVDIVYCHFWKMGFISISFKCDKPLFIASGESEINVAKHNHSKIGTLRDRISGVVYVSKKNYEESIDKRLQGSFPYIIAPNGVNTDVFYRHDKDQCRKELGINKESVAGIFVGSFDDRKGIRRVEAAISDIEGLGMIYIGNGIIQPCGSNVLFSGTVPHDQIPLYLSAADFFILPTLAEGCCNAIVEALACGIPVISSNLPFNDELLDDSNSIRIDPEDIDQIHNAVLKILDNKQRANLTMGAIRKSKELGLKSRAQRILNFINECIQKNK